jgi:15-cis-phytoene synthase
MEPELLSSYKLAEAVARRRARNFYYSFVVLPPEKRRAFCAIYAFMRYCDDAADCGASLEARRELLRNWRLRLNEVYSDTSHHNSFLLAFRDSIRQFSIPADYFHWVIDGAEMDLDICRYEKFEDLYKYCFNVASAVGLVCLQIFGFVDEQAKKYAEQCGIAFQLTNILRDLKEDAQMGRIYLPAEDLERFDYAPEDLRRGIVDERFKKLMKFETDRARDYYAQAHNLIPMVHDASKPALWAMIEIYERLLNKIVQRQYDVFRDSIHLAAPEKVAIALRAIAMRCFGGVA